MRQISSDSTADLSINFTENSDLPSIFAFPKDGNFWRIDWFGEIAFPDRLQRRKQPSVLVHLSRVLDASFQENPSVLLSRESTFAARQRKVWISVGTLPLLSVGDIWRDGRLALRPDYEVEHFPNLDISEQTAVLVKAGLKLDDLAFLLPSTEHPWHMQCTHSYCLMVDLPHDRRLLIPCMELVRFYFGSSSNLLTKLFLPPLTRDSLYSKPYFDRISGRLTIELAPGISGASAADIGRLHMESDAWRAAAHVGASLLKQSSGGEGRYPQAFFPFEGQTDLVASGKWLSHGEDPRRTFVVYSMRSCSYAFPFRSLRYNVKARGPAPAIPQSAERNAPGNGPVRRASKQPNDQEIVERDSSNRLAHQTKAIWRSVRFPDLDKKTIWKNRVLKDAEGAPAPKAAFTEGARQLAVGDPGSEQRIRPIDLNLAIRRDFPVPDFLKDIVDELKALKDFSVELLTESLEDGWTIPLPAPANEEGEIDVRLFVELGSHSLRERRIAIFKLDNVREQLAIVAIESAPTHIQTYPAPKGDLENPADFLSKAAADFASIPSAQQERIRHPIPSYLPETFR